MATVQVRRLKAAHFLAHKTFDQFEFTVQPTVNKPLVAQLTAGESLNSKENVLLIGPRGTGRSRLAISLAMRSKLKPIKEMAGTLRPHQELLLDWFRAKREI